MAKAILYSLLAGGLATSAAEYFLGYNLIDFLKDRVLELLAKVPRWL